MRNLNEIAADMAEQSNVVHERIRAGMAENARLMELVAGLEARLTAMEAEADAAKARADGLTTLLGEVHAKATVPAHQHCHLSCVTLREIFHLTKPSTLEGGR